MRISKLTAGAALASALLAIGVFATSPAKASPVVFDFSYSGNLQGNVISGFGTITATDNGGGSYTAVSGSGTSTEAGALTLLAPGTYINTLSPSVNLGPSDNLLFPSSNPLLTGNGLVFQGTAPPLDPNSVYLSIWANGPGNYSYFNNYDSFPNSNDYYNTGSNTFELSFASTSLAATPLPAALPLFASGLGALGLLGWRRKRKAQAAA